MARHGSHLLGLSGGRRPPAPIGWGSHTWPARPLAPSVARRPRGCGLRPVLTGASRGRQPPKRRREGTARGTTSRQAHWDRRRVRTTTTARTRAPSIGSSRISRSEQGRSRSLFARAALSFAPGRSLRAQPAPSRARGSPRATSLATTCPGFPRTKPRQRERCVSPTSATNSRHEHLHAARLPTAPTPRPLAFARGIVGPAPTRPGAPPRLSPPRHDRERITGWSSA